MSRLTSKLEQYLGDRYDNCDELSSFDKDDVLQNIETLKELKIEIEKNPTITLAFIVSLINEHETELLDRGFCPKCGAEMEIRETSKGDYYNPSTEAGYCSSCGYIEE